MLRCSDPRGSNRRHKNELHNFCFSPGAVRIIKSRNVRWARRIADTRRRLAYKFLVGKHEGWRSLGRLRRRCKDNIKIDLTEKDMRM